MDIQSRRDLMASVAGSGPLGYTEQRRHPKQECGERGGRHPAATLNDAYNTSILNWPIETLLNQALVNKDVVHLSSWPKPVA